VDGVAFIGDLDCKLRTWVRTWAEVRTHGAQGWEARKPPIWRLSGGRHEPAPQSANPDSTAVCSGLSGHCPRHSIHQGRTRKFYVFITLFDSIDLGLDLALAANQSLSSEHY